MIPCKAPWPTAGTTAGTAAMPPTAPMLSPPAATSTSATSPITPSSWWRVARQATATPPRYRCRAWPTASRTSRWLSTTASRVPVMAPSRWATITQTMFSPPSRPCPLITVATVAIRSASLPPRCPMPRWCCAGTMAARGTLWSSTTSRSSTTRHPTPPPPSRWTASESPTPV